MAKFETNYPVEGSSALKPNAHQHADGATIIAFPGLADNAASERRLTSNNVCRQTNRYYRIASLIDCPLKERKIVRNLKNGSLAGIPYGNASRKEAIIGGALFAIATLALFLLGC